MPTLEQILEDRERMPPPPPRPAGPPPPHARSVHRLFRLAYHRIVPPLRPNARRRLRH